MGMRSISWKAVDPDGGYESWLLTCAQFLTCPTTASGSSKDCSKAHQIINNSWGSKVGGDNWFAATIKTWRAANIIPVFSNGNQGSACSTTSSPADDPNVIAVGATTSADKLAWFSSRGPSAFATIKPDISAPGDNVNSASNAGVTATKLDSGTSMAAPHVSGVIALLLSKSPSLTFDKIKSTLINTADRSTLCASGQTCGGTKDSAVPNNQYGYGRINALKAFNAV